jgi:hypothetical protein
MPETHDDVIRDKHVPRRGDTLRSKKHKTIASDQVKTARR